MYRVIFSINNELLLKNGFLNPDIIVTVIKNCNVITKLLL